MKITGNKTRGLFFVAVFLNGLGSARAELPSEIRVVNYSIHNGVGLDGKVDLSRVAKIIAAQKPDIVALQQVDDKTKRSGGVDQAAELGRLTGLKAMFSRAIDLDGGGFGNAVLTNLPVRSQETIKLKIYKDSEPKRAQQHVVQVVELGGKEKAELVFVCTCLDDRSKSAERLKSAKSINELIEKHGDTPAILAGQLNSGPGHNVLREFAKAWKVAGVDPTGTRIEPVGEEGAAKYVDVRAYPADQPRYMADAILCRPAGSWRVVDLRIIEEKVASTHRPILAVLRRVEKAEKTDVAGSAK